MPPTDQTRIDYVCLKFLDELTEPLTAIECHTGAVRRLSTSQGSNSPANLADSLEQIPLEIRASDVIKRFRSYLQKEAKQQLELCAEESKGFDCCDRDQSCDQVRSGLAAGGSRIRTLGPSGDEPSDCGYRGNLQLDNTGISSMTRQRSSWSRMGMPRSAMLETTVSDNG
jgi:hypothetical protein